jgi:endonuclease/exonuclease/phosphatase family metal-dependent hydrolase
LQEVGGEAALADIQSRVRALGLNYPHSAWAQGWDTNIQVALLSRAPIVSRRVHAQDSYLVSGRRFRVSRGILEADIQLTRDYRVTVFTAHLKSRREVPDADQAAMRAAEARILREKIDARLKEDPNANILVLGDLNDTKDSLPVRTIFGRGRHRLVDTRPAERNGDTGYSPNPRHDPRTVTWTHYYGVEDAYGRIDYILAHPNAARELVEGGAMIPSVPNWGVASDHRPILVTIEARDR